MSRSSFSATCRIALLSAATILSAAIPSAAATATADGIMAEACAAPRPMLPDGIERQVEGLIGDAHCYRLELPAAGMWHLSIAATTAAETGAVFDVFDSVGRRASLETFERSAAERLAFVPAGSWRIRVRAEDPLRPLPAYRLASRFVEAARTEVIWKSEEDGELEIEGEGIVAGCASSPLKSEEDGELEIEGEGIVAGCVSPAFKSEEDGELEIEGEGIVAGCAGRADEIRQALCDAEDGDDHGDILTCATRVRCRAVGELANGWGDDADVFRFRVGRWQTVEVAARGGDGIRGELLGGDGQRLEIAEGIGGGFRLVRTLGPGDYFVKVSGEAAGSYRLTIRHLDR